MAEKNEKEKAVNEQIRDFGQVELEHGEDRISMLTIIGEIEGHECLPAATKTTKYEHVLPKLAEVEENKNVDGFEGYHKRRLSMTPGLTGVWQVSGRSDITDFEEIVSMDVEYIKNWSLKRDIEIILKTVQVVLHSDGAR